VGWALIASPLGVHPVEQALSGSAPGRIVATGLPSGPFSLWAGPVPVGSVRFHQARAIFSGENAPTGEILALGWLWLPWPHVDRVPIIPTGNNTVDNWSFPEATHARRDGRNLYLTGTRATPTGKLGTDVRAIEFGLSPSWITWAGWLVIVFQLFWRRGRPPEDRESY
jgi:hypothetical protein